MSTMTLIQIPFSHNCVKVRVALDLKRVPYETKNIPPSKREAVFAASGQGMVPVLMDDGRAIPDSTAILLHLEERFPETPLLPRDPALRAECLLLEDWADQAFMARSRRISYGTVLSQPGRLGRMFFPNDAAPARWIKERIARRVVTKRFGLSAARHVNDVVEAKRLAALAVERLAGRPWLFGDKPTIADIAWATMSAPLAVDRVVREDPAVKALLAWGEALLPADIRTRYRGA